MTPTETGADPYHGGPDGFEDLLAVVERTADALVPRLTGGRPRLPRQDA